MAKPKAKKPAKDTRITEYFSSSPAAPAAKKRKAPPIVNVDDDDDETFQLPPAKKAKKLDPPAKSRGNTTRNPIQRVKAQPVASGSNSTPAAQKYATPKSMARPPVAKAQDRPPPAIIDLTEETQLPVDDAEPVSSPIREQPSSPLRAPASPKPAAINRLTLPTPGTSTPVRRARTHPDILMSTPSSSAKSSPIRPPAPTRRTNSFPVSMSPVPSSQQTDDEYYAANHSPFRSPVRVRRTRPADINWDAVPSSQPGERLLADYAAPNLFKVPALPNKKDAAEDEIVPDSQPEEELDEDEIFEDANKTIGNDTIIVEPSPKKAQPMSLARSQSGSALDITELFEDDDEDEDAPSGSNDDVLLGLGAQDDGPGSKPVATQDSSQTQPESDFSQCSFSVKPMDRPLWQPPNATQSNSDSDDAPVVESQAAQAASLQETQESLPDIMKQFRDMFDNHEGSYPPDISQSQGDFWK